MVFYDANLFYAIPMLSMIPRYPGMNTLAEIDAALQRAGVKGGLIRNLSADGGIVTSNTILANDLKTAKSDLYGIYTLAPSCCGDLPAPKDLPEVMKADRMMAIRFTPSMPGFPGFVSRPAVMGDYLAVASEKRIPVVFDTVNGLTPDQIWDYMEAFPELTAIFAPKYSWPVDRIFRPFLERFPNLLLDLSCMITDQGIEHLVEKYGAERFLYATRYPSQYMGGSMFMLRAAQITQEQKDLIAGGNFIRIGGWMK